MNIIYSFVIYIISQIKPLPVKQMLILKQLIAGVFTLS